MEGTLPGKGNWWLAFLLLGAPIVCARSISAAPTMQDSPAAATAAPDIYAPGLVSGPANDGSPTFSPDGNTMCFSRSSANWTMILQSNKIAGQWSKPSIAPFSGEWSDSSPEFSPDGSYVVFQSSRPVAAADPADPSKPPRRVSNIWRVDRVSSGWSKPQRLPDAVNLPGQSLWKPSVAADGTLYFTAIDEKRNKRLYSSQYTNGAYQQAQPLPFSDGTKQDVDPEIAPDGSFLIFVSAGRLPDDQKDHLFIVFKKGDDWGPPAPIRYAGDANDGYSTDDEPHLSRDHRAVYFTSDRVVPVHFPLTPEQAQQTFKELESSGWFTGYANVWSLSLAPWLKADNPEKPGASK
jgi:Tol biopolymer transport system component